ncbi:hypothetical protein LRN53_14880, partial [Staphylococcus aureus]
LILALHKEPSMESEKSILKIRNHANRDI